MTTIDDLHQFLLLIAIKVLTGRLSHGQLNRAVNHAELQLLVDRLGRPAEYQPGRPVARTGGEGITQKVDDDLARFLVVATYVPTAAAPHWPRPAGLLHVIADALRGTCQPARGWDAPATDPLPPVRAVEVDLLSQSELARRLGSALNPPRATVPLATLTATELEVYPAGALLSVTIPYRRKPVFSKWVGTADPTTGRLVYSAATSIPTEWPLDTWNELAMRALAYLGVHLSAPQVAQFAEAKTQQG